MQRLGQQRPEVPVVVDTAHPRARIALDGVVQVRKLERVAQEEDGTESYIQVEDEAVQQAVFDKFLQLVNEGSGDDE